MKNGIEPVGNEGAGFFHGLGEHVVIAVDQAQLAVLDFVVVTFSIGVGNHAVMGAVDYECGSGILP